MGGDRCGAAVECRSAPWHCASDDSSIILADSATELNLLDVPCSSALIKHKSLVPARRVVSRVFADLESEFLDKQAQCERTGHMPARPKLNRIATYTDRARIEEFIRNSMAFIEKNAECRAYRLSDEHLGFLVLLQHLVAEDTQDFYRPPAERKHQDTFEGFRTEGINSQLVKDAHRSEWSIGGASFSLHAKNKQDTNEAKFGMQDAKKQQPSDEEQDGSEEKQKINAFQKKLVIELEEFLLDFCSRSGLTDEETRKLLQAVTTQMSQCGLANLESSSNAAKYFVSGDQLEQRTVYSISILDATSELSESLKLSMLCLKTGFSQYTTEKALHISSRGKGLGVNHCAPTSYLYQYATLRFTVDPPLGNGFERCCECVVVDALDEVHIDHVVSI